MKIKFRVIIVPLILFMLFNVSCKGVNKEEPYPDIKIPIYADATKVSSLLDIKKCIKAKSYHIQMEYPATPIVDFYEKEMVRLGFTELRDPDHPLDEWMEFSDGTRPGIPRVRQFAKMWLKSKEKIEFFLVLRYETISSNKWNNDLLVSCQFTPYLGSKRLFEFTQKLDKEGKYWQFEKLMKKYYLESEGKADCEKAIRENPGNQYVLEYCLIQKEIYEQIKCR